MTNKFIQKARAIHGDKYNYSKTILTRWKDKIIITCPIHGEFLQLPNNHIAGNGCPSCSNLYRYSTEEFIQKAKAIHGDKYNYSKSIYKSNRNKIIITCLRHGDFIQLPQNHLQGIGCSKCRNEDVGNRFRLNINKFVEKARTIHANKYDYSKVNYINGKTKITIVCPKHGDFIQSPNNHLSGRGCPKCNASIGELTIKTILDKYSIINITEYKLPEIISKLEYDFYLPEYNILIEFHGIQHFEYVPFLHDYDEDNFDKQKERDILKLDHALRFKYRMLEFNYKQLKHMTSQQFEEMLISSIMKYNK